jgi:hypothetical protein
MSDYEKQKVKFKVPVIQINLLPFPCPDFLSEVNQMSSFAAALCAFTHTLSSDGFSA